MFDTPIILPFTSILKHLNLFITISYLLIYVRNTAFCYCYLFLNITNYNLIGAPEWDRTTGPQFRKLVLYPTELQALKRASIAKITLIS